MGLFGRGYDDEYDRGFRGRSDLGRGSWGRGMGGGGWPDQGSGWNRSGYRRPGYDNPYRSRYDAGYGYRGYDRGYKSRWQTDHGDPFGDRVQQTPIRVVREEHRDRDEGLFARSSYGREYQHRGFPFGYIPYAQRAGYDAGYGNRAGRWRGREYDDFRY